MNKQLYLIVNIVILLFIAAIAGIQFIGVRRMRNKLREIHRCKTALNEMEDLITITNNKKEVYMLILTTVLNILGKGDKAWLLVKGNDGRYHCEASVGYGGSIDRKAYTGDELNPDRLKKFLEIKTSNNIILSGKELVDESQIVTPMVCDGDLVAVLSIKTLKGSKKLNKKDKQLLHEIRHELELVIKNFTVKDKFKYIATHDGLTDLYNRRYFTQIFIDELEWIKKKKSVHYLAVIDLDNFKTINDVYGHNEGDIAIKNMANAMRHILQDKDVYARLSGDEFITLFKNQTHEEVENKISNMKEYLRTLEGVTKLDFSYGLAEVHYKDNMNRDDLFSIADKAMYENKKSKKVGR